MFDSVPAASADQESAPAPDPVSQRKPGPEAREEEAPPADSAWNLDVPWLAGSVPAAVEDSRSDEFNSSLGQAQPSSWDLPEAAPPEQNPGAPASAPFPGPGEHPGRASAARTEPLPAADRRARAKRRAVSPLSIAAVLLAALVLGVILILGALGGVDGLKARIVDRLQGASPPVPLAPSPSAPPFPGQAPGQAPGESQPQAPAIPEEQAPLLAATEDSSPEDLTAGPPELAPALDPDEEPDPFIPKDPAPPAETASPPAALSPPPAVADSAPGDAPPPAAGAGQGGGGAPSLAEFPPSPPASPVGSSPGEILPGQDAGAGSDDGKESAGMEERMATLLGTVGAEVLESYYRSPSIDGRASFVIDRELNQPRMEAFYRRASALPGLRSLSFRGPMRDAASGRWFGVFDVREDGDEKVHRWCVVQVQPGEMKLDWVIYQQLVDEALDRFLADPASPPKEFRLVARRGGQAPAEDNPWQGVTWELEIQPPLDIALPRVVMVRDSDLKQLGLDSALVDGNSRIGQMELGWVPSELEPLSRVPTVTRVVRWGAW